jgi:hypothetical protein
VRAGTQGSQSLALGLATIAASQLKAKSAGPANQNLRHLRILPKKLFRQVMEFLFH